MSTSTFPLPFPPCGGPHTSAHLPLPAQSNVLLATHSQHRSRGGLATGLPFGVQRGGSGRPSEVRQREPGSGNEEASREGNKEASKEERWSLGTRQCPRSPVPCTTAAQHRCPSATPARCPNPTALTLLCTSSPCHPPASASEAPWGPPPSCIHCQLRPPSHSGPSTWPNENSILDLLGAFASPAELSKETHNHTDRGLAAGVSPNATM